MKNINLTEVPSTTASYLKLISRFSSQIPDNGQLPGLKYTLNDLTINPQHLELFNKLCGVNQDSLFATYPYVLAGPVMLALVADKHFPIVPAGLLHLRNRISILEDLDPKQSYAIEVFTYSGRFRAQGFEFDMLTEMKRNDTCVWRSKSTFLKKVKIHKEDPAAEDENIYTKLDDTHFLTEKVSVPADIGRRYAKICKDYNPIHISSIAASLFGYKRSIAHGMWVLARTTTLLNGNSRITQLDASFKGPTFTNEQLSFKRSGENINIFCGSNPRPVILVKVK
ncbi:MAG: hypothetical protein MK132_01925 [Lentisphaerales bacterium]|nr:hypothetical protein [Lentisphaerales bacterium]